MYYLSVLTTAEGSHKGYEVSILIIYEDKLELTLKFMKNIKQSFSFLFFLSNIYVLVNE